MHMQIAGVFISKLGTKKLSKKEHNYFSEMLVKWADKLEAKGLMAKKALRFLQKLV